MNDTKKVKKWIRRNHAIINIIIGIIGLLLFAISAYIPGISDTVSNFIAEIGMALITNAILLVFSLLYFKEDSDYDEAKEIYEKKGLVCIYDSKKGINDKINKELLPNHSVHEYDILCCGGLTTLRKEEGNKILEYIRRNRMQVRILTANPYLDYLLQQKIDEDNELVNTYVYRTTPIENTIKRSIFELYEWVVEKRNELPDYLKENLQIRFYESLPPLQLHRVGNHVFIGQSMVGANSQASPTFEYIDSGNPNDYFMRYTKYFEMLWSDPNYAQDLPQVRINPQLIINNNVINNILKLSCSDMACDLGIEDNNRIRGVFTICGFPKPLSDGLERRYNTNITRGNEICSIQESNGESVNGKKQGYLAADESQVVGKSIKSGDIAFEVTKLPGKYSILAIPLKNRDNKVVAAISYEFDSDYNECLSILDGDVNILPKNELLVEKAKQWAKLLSVYLKLDE